MHSWRTKFFNRWFYLAICLVVIAVFTPVGDKAVTMAGNNYLAKSGFITATYHPESSNSKWVIKIDIFEPLPGTNFARGHGNGRAMPYIFKAQFIYFIEEETGAQALTQVIAITLFGQIFPEDPGADIYQTCVASHDTYTIEKAILPEKCIIRGNGLVYASIAHKETAVLNDDEYLYMIPSNTATIIASFPGSPAVSGEYRPLIRDQPYLA